MGRSDFGRIRAAGSGLGGLVAGLLILVAGTALPAAAGDLSSFFSERRWLGRCVDPGPRRNEVMRQCGRDYGIVWLLRFKESLDDTTLRAASFTHNGKTFDFEIELDDPIDWRGTPQAWADEGFYVAGDVTRGLLGDLYIEDAAILGFPFAENGPRSEDIPVEITLRDYHVRCHKAASPEIFTRQCLGLWMLVDSFYDRHEGNTLYTTVIRKHGLQAVIHLDSDSPLEDADKPDHYRGHRLRLYGRVAPAEGVYLALDQAEVITAPTMP